MNYRSINTAILAARDLPNSYVKDRRFYDYLLGNNVAYYYSHNLSTKKNSMDRKIIIAGNKLNEKYFKTLKLINKACKENRIKFLLFKTYKYIPEAVDNDIDLLIKNRDFYRFMEILEKKGFKCIENEPLKGICQRNSFCTIEPRINSSFHGLIIMNEKQLWDKVESVNIAGIKIFKPIKEIEIAHLLLSLLYNPNYLKLYLLIIYKNSNLKNLGILNLEENVKQELELIVEKLVTKNVENKRFPLFLGNIPFIKWWYRRIFLNSKLTLYTRLKHIMYFFYLKYLYVLFDKLVFQHRWPIQ